MDKVYFGIKKGGLGCFEPTNLGVVFRQQEDGNYKAIDSFGKEYFNTKEEILHDLEKGFLVDSEGLYRYFFNQQGKIEIDLSNVNSESFDIERFLDFSRRQNITFIKPEISYQEAIKIVCDTLKKDKEMYRAYKDNIAMAFKDEHSKQTEGLDSEEIGYKQDIHEIANQAADNFLQLLIK